jgi:hypothetical protein
VENPFLPEDQPADVTRIEWDFLESGRWRWTAWSGERRLMSVVVSEGGIDKMLEATGTFAKGMAARAAVRIMPPCQPNRSTDARR